MSENNTNIEEVYNSIQNILNTDLDACKANMILNLEALQSEMNLKFSSSKRKTYQRVSNLKVNININQLKNSGLAFFKV